MQLTAPTKKLYTNLGIGLLTGGVAVTGGGVASAIFGFDTNEKPIYVALFLTGVTVGPSAIVAGSVLLGLGLAAKVKN